MKAIPTVGALLTAVLALSLVPLVIDQTIEGSNPFTFVAIQTSAQIVALAIYLRLTAQGLFDTTKIKKIVGPVKNLLVNSHTKSNSRINLAVWARTPFFWAVIVGLEYSLFGWSIRYVDTAVATIVFALWPLVMIYALIYLSDETEGSNPYHISFRKKLLTAIALIGLVVVVLGQTPEDASLFSNEMLPTVFGILLAFSAGFVNGMNPAMSIHFSDLLYDRVKRPKPIIRGLRAKQKLWLSLYAVTAGRILSLPVNLTLGFTVFSRDLGIEPKAAIAAAASGFILLPTASVLLRKANLSVSDLSINALCYAEPVFTMTWLLLLTNVEVPNFGLFMVGAVIIIATNTIIQLVPDPKVHVPTIAPTGG